jgi:hypothetical protein
MSPDEALAEVAAIYMAAWRARGNPTKAVAESLSLSRSAAAKRVARARQAGLLPATTKGRPAGRGTDGVDREVEGQPLQGPPARRQWPAPVQGVRPEGRR